MKTLFSIIFLTSCLAFTQVIYAQCKPKNYAELFDLEVFEQEKGDKFLIQRVASVNPKACYAESVNEMPDYFSYLQNNFSDRSKYADLDLDQDSTELRLAFSEALAQDDKLTAILDEHFLKYTGSLKRDQVVFEELIDVATKFFTVKDINEEDQYLVKVCTGINLMEATLPKRKPFLEALAFAAILDDIKNQPNTNLMTEFQKEMKSLYDLNLGTDKDEKLLRAQGAAMMLMKKNVRLQSILATYYLKHAKLLPFELINSPQ